MKLKITINNVQHLAKLQANFDLSENKLSCITGKNGTGKTTLIRAIKNLAINNTFQETAAPYIFNTESSISYQIEGFDQIDFIYNRFLKIIDSNQHIPDEIRSMISVELPIPHGERFNHFSRLADIDEELRASISLGTYTRPNELIDFLTKVYCDERFENLKQAIIKKNTYYFILKDEKERFYIREDYFSSGEYFVINLYKQMQQRTKLIVIDEIDISLDASAQVNLVSLLRNYCKQYKINIVFTTHSLALMKTLEKGELYYMEKTSYKSNNLVSLTPRSYNFVKTIMYGFIGFDRYILTEDECLEDYMKFLISSDAQHIFYKLQIVYVAGGSQVVDLMGRNVADKFLSEPENVISVLDGDQKDQRYIKNKSNIMFLPFSNIEKVIYELYESNDERIPRVSSIEGGTPTKRAKNLFWKLTKIHAGEQLMSKKAIYALLQELNPEGVNEFKQYLIDFVNPT
ncbi:DNA replication and repair protein RecF [Pseudoalteromonas sp. P1-13-1a]|uniref:AAA family ATPase n=1 Tax=Pseudoalteromonas sp. P1-13-1a TaxID=1723756 RepID=UPI0006D67DBA|nr:AAA family ATPase [Pseudoalteromonas sp. P1-13-1a]KPZ54022.1 DNA replication and repair protein RecF [Pseudoalteromonas sp. P1-13-1a]